MAPSPSNRDGGGGEEEGASKPIKSITTRGGAPASAPTAAAAPTEEAAAAATAAATTGPGALVGVSDHNNSGMLSWDLVARQQKTNLRHSISLAHYKHKTRGKKVFFFLKK